MSNASGPSKGGKSEPQRRTMPQVPCSALPMNKRNEEARIVEAEVWFELMGVMLGAMRRRKPISHGATRVVTAPTRLTLAAAPITLLRAHVMVNARACPTLTRASY